MTTAPELHPIPVKSPWYHIGIDFVGPLPESPSGNKYILTLSDYCTKWVDAVALPSKCAPGVAGALFKVCVCYRLGNFRCILTSVFVLSVPSTNNSTTLCLNFYRYSCEWGCHKCSPLTRELSSRTN